MNILQQQFVLFLHGSAQLSRNSEDCWVNSLRYLSTLLKSEIHHADNLEEVPEIGVCHIFPVEIVEENSIFFYIFPVKTRNNGKLWNVRRTLLAGMKNRSPSCFRPRNSHAPLAPAGWRLPWYRFWPRQICNNYSSNCRLTSWIVQWYRTPWLTWKRAFAWPVVYRWSSPSWAPLLLSWDGSASSRVCIFCHRRNCIKTCFSLRTRKERYWPSSWEKDYQSSSAKDSVSWMETELLK